ncbi:MAG: DUF4012 domain-containing protein, partial [Chloroflexi bacterium]|nr:DUF4012 domain-containing protein [Chloroflexota bacterium]
MNILRLILTKLRHPATSTWLAAAGVVALAAAIALWQVGAGVAPVAFGAEASLSELRSVEFDNLLEDSSSLEALRRRALAIEQELETPSRAARWARRFAPALSWLPLAGQEIDAWASQLERAHSDANAASTLLDASSELLRVIEGSQSALVTPEAGASISLLKAQARGLEADFSSSLAAIESASQMKGRFGVGLQAPRVRSLVGALDEMERQMTDAARVEGEVSGLMVELLEVADAAQPFISQLSGEGDSPTPTAEDLNAALAAMRARSLAAKGKAEVVAALLSESEYGARLEPELASLDVALDAVLSVGEAGAIALDALQPVLSDLEASNSGLLDANGGLLLLMDTLNQRRDDISEAIARLDGAEQLLNGLDASQGRGLTFAGLARIRGVVSQMRDGLALMHGIAPLGGELLGAGGVRRYLVLGQSADELRATGGFVSAAWEVTFVDGGLAEIKYQDAVRVDDFERLHLYPVAPPGLETHMNGWVWLLRDVSWDPDFPTTARSAQDLYRIGQRQEVDGVIAINQWTLLRALDALGEIPSPEGGPSITPRNLLSSLEQGTDQHGRAYMDLVLQGALESLNGQASLSKLMRLASSLYDTLETRDTLLHFDDPALQSLIASFGWDGSVSQGTGDYLYVVDSNVGWSKADRNIEREVSYTVDLNRQSRPRASLTLEYANHSGPGSVGCIPQWQNRGSSYGQLKNACYWNFLRVYIPQEARLLASTPLPLPEHTVAVEIGKGAPGQETGEISSSHNRTVFSGLTSLEAGERKQISLVYDLPASVLRKSDGSLV